MVSRRSGDVMVRHAEMENISGGMDDILSGCTSSMADMKKGAGVLWWRVNVGR